MKKIFSMCLIALLSVFTLCSCSFTNPEYDEEVALKKTPWFFGETGVDETPVNSMTMIAPTTDAVHFYILPQKKTFKFDDLFSNDNTPLDITSYLTIQVKKGHTPELLKNYGENWFENFIEPEFRKKFRGQVSVYSPFDLISNREVLEKMDNKLKNDMIAYINHLSKTNGVMPISIISVTTDRAMPNNEQLAEMNRTAAAIQAKQTQEKRAEMEIARAKAEANKAIADKAYMNEMNLSAGQFIQLKYIDMIAAKKDANIDVLIGGGEQPMWNIRR